MADGAYGDFLAERRAQILGRIEDAARRAGREPGGISLVAVSKTVGAPELVAAMEAGYDAFGENRPQELVRKLSALDALGIEPPRFDMVGNLQTNKVNQVLGRVRLIHSLSSLHLAQAVSKRAEARGMVQEALLEVNVSGEASKSGFSPDEARAQAEDLMGLAGIRLAGLMSMAPAGDPAAARASFSGLRELKDELEARCGIALPVLSCGMSDDFEIAVEEGSTLVRLGRIVFDRGYTCR